jgi:hypothetical protein
MSSVHANVRRLVLQSLGTTSPECGICLEPLRPRRCHGHGVLPPHLQGTASTSSGKGSVRSAATSSHPTQGRPRENSREINLASQGRRHAQQRGELPGTRKRPPRAATQERAAAWSIAAARQPHRQRPGLRPHGPNLLARDARFSPDPPPAEWEPRATTPVAPQPPTRTVARVLWPDEPNLVDLFGSDSESESDSDVEIREVVQRSEPVPRRRGPCRCTLCGELGHQRNNRRFHPNN